MPVGGRSTEELDRRRDDLAAVAPTAVVFGFELPSAETTFDENLASLFKMLGADFAQAGKSDYRMPFDAFLRVAIFVIEGLVGSD